MNRIDVIRLAWEAAAHFDAQEPFPEYLERFANLVIEECAKVCDGYEVPDNILGAHPDYLEGKLMAFKQAASAIRARKVK